MILSIRFFFKLAIIITFLFSFSLYFSKETTAATVLFSDNFDDGNSNGWIVTRNPCFDNGSAALWEVVGGKLGIKINGPSCVTEIMPDNSSWGSIGNDYAVDFDMELVSGTDHNFAFRYTNPDDWYDFHIQSPSRLILQRVLNTHLYNNEVIFPFPNSQTYHFRVEVKGEHIKIFVDSPPVLILDYPDAGGRFPTGRIALQASVGAHPFSETYFDNIVVTSLDDGPETPYFSQSDPSWRSEQYNSSAYTVGQLGCGLSVGAMVLASYGIDTLPDGSRLDVSSLNNWLNQNPDGFWRNGLTSWAAIMRLTKIMNASDSALPLLDYREIRPPNFTEINQILAEEQHPLIFEEFRPLSPSGIHFTAATSVATPSTSYDILDPFDASRSSFLIPPDNLVSARYLFPTNTNLSYLILNVDSGVDTLITNPSSNKMGKNKSGDEFTEISDSVFSIGYPLVDDENQSESAGEVFWKHLIADPITGEYRLELNTNQSGWYDFELYAYNRDASVEVFKENVFVGSDYPTIFKLDYIQDVDVDFADLTKVVDFETLKNDVKAMRDLGFITKNGISRPLTAYLNSAQRLYPRVIRLTNHFLGLFEYRLNRYHPKFISNEAHSFLLEELFLLRDSL